MQHCALQHSAWHGICMEQMRLSGMNLAGVGVDVGASEAIL
jgi:predicted anti-sigma-YlaC factor YlaD